MMISIIFCKFLQRRKEIGEMEQLFFILLQRTANTLQKTDVQTLRASFALVRLGDILLSRE